MTAPRPCQLYNDTGRPVFVLVSGDPMTAVVAPTRESTSTVGYPPRYAFDRTGPWLPMRLDPETGCWRTEPMTVTVTNGTSHTVRLLDGGGTLMAGQTFCVRLRNGAVDPWIGYVVQTRSGTTTEYHQRVPESGRVRITFPSG